jgi:hypothetical protein
MRNTGYGSLKLGCRVALRNQLVHYAGTVRTIGASHSLRQLKLNLTRARRA